MKKQQETVLKVRKTGWGGTNHNQTPLKVCKGLNSSNHNQTPLKVRRIGVYNHNQTALKAK